MNSDLQPEGSNAASKRRRRACDRCHRSGIKASRCLPILQLPTLIKQCSSGADPAACGPCAAFGSACTYDRPVKRRGPAARTHEDIPTPRGSSDVPLNGGADGTGRHVRSGIGAGARHVELEDEDDQWAYRDVASQNLVLELAEAYHEISYPLQNYFHWPTFMRDLSALRYTHDRPFYSTVMALCALTAARLRDGACLDSRKSGSVGSYANARRILHHRSLSHDRDRLGPLPPPPDSDDPPHPSLAPGPTSEDFYAAAVSSFPRDLAQATDFNYKRAKTLLALLCIQYGDVRRLQVHLGDYITMMAIDGSAVEARWPSGLSEVEIQERRRMFWATYQMDVYVAIVWGGTIRHRESEAAVLYPAEVYDDIEVLPTGILPTSAGRTSFLTGFNFTTDLYRVLEHAVAMYRSRRRGADSDASWSSGPSPGGPVWALFRNAEPAAADVLALVARLYAEMPEELRVVRAVSGDPQQNRIAFQAVNIIITMQTLKMVLAGSADSSVSQRCEIAGELLNALANVPTAYIQAVSTPTLHHLAGVGHLLGQVIQSPLSQWAYLQVRNVLLSLADLLAGLESALSSTAGIAPRLRAHVSRIDAYMADAARERAAEGVLHLSRDFGCGGRGGAGTWIGDENGSGAGAGEGRRPDEGESPPLTRLHEGASTQMPVRVQAHARGLVDVAAFDPSLLRHGEAAHSAPTPLSELDPSLLAATAPPLPLSLSLSQQVLLPENLFADWPFDLGQGDAFDLMGDLGGFWAGGQGAEE